MMFFDFRMIVGNRETVYSEAQIQLYYGVTSQTRLFGSAVNAEGKSSKSMGKIYLVTGVMQVFGVPGGHMEFDFLASFKRQPR